MTYHYYVSYVTNRGGYGCAEVVIPNQITSWSNIVLLQDMLVENLPKDGLPGDQVIILYWTLLRSENT